MRERRGGSGPQPVTALRTPLPKVSLGDDSGFPSIWKECLWESSFWKLHHNCHVGELAGKALQLGVTVGKGGKKKNGEGPGSGHGHQFSIAEFHLQRKKMYLRNHLSQKDCDWEVLYLHGKNAVKDAQTSAPSSLLKRMGVQHHRPLRSYTLLSTSNPLRISNRQQQAARWPPPAPNHWYQEKKGCSWKSLSNKPGYD